MGNCANNCTACDGKGNEPAEFDMAGGAQTQVQKHVDRDISYGNTKTAHLEKENYYDNSFLKSKVHYITKLQAQCRGYLAR